MPTYVFIDASNLFYGGEKSLGWKIDYKKLLEYLREKYKAKEVLYFGGVEAHDFPHDYLAHDTVPLGPLEKHVAGLVENGKSRLNEAELTLLGRHLNRIRFYKKLESFGYQLALKPVKHYEQDDGTVKRKANCDVDMAFRLMKEQTNFDRVVVLSGDGDFLPVLKYLRGGGKEVVVMGRGARTAKEIKQFADGDFKDFEYLRNLIKWEEK